MSEKARYQIQTWDTYSNSWTSDGIGDPDVNLFNTKSEAEEAIAALRELGPEWAEAKYRVVEVTQ